MHSESHTQRGASRGCAWYRLETGVVEDANVNAEYLFRFRSNYC